MANQPHPDRKAVTWRLHRDLVAAVQAAAAANVETVLDFATRALQREVARGDSDRNSPIPADRVDDMADYLDAMSGLASGSEVVIDPKRPGDLQAFRDFAAEANGNFGGGETDNREREG